ncbi:hypothetical protein D3C76_1188050 [compost metagenome]
MQAAGFPGFGHHLAQLVGGTFCRLPDRFELAGIDILWGHDKGALGTQQHQVAVLDGIEGDPQVVLVIQCFVDRCPGPLDPGLRRFTQQRATKHHDAAIGDFQFRWRRCRIQRFRRVLGPQQYRPTHREHDDQWGEEPAPHASVSLRHRFWTRVRIAA